MNTDLLNELIEMRRHDLDVRASLLAEGRLHGEYAEEMRRAHTENAHRLDELVTRYGWPGLSLVGLEGTRAAWSIAQHAICTPQLQRKFLALITACATAGEIPRLQAAFLTDRVRAAEGRPQRYGTVLDWNETGALGCEVEDPANLDARRLEVGLPAFADDLAAHQREVEAEGVSRICARIASLTWRTRPLPASSPDSFRGPVTVRRLFRSPGRARG